MRLSKISLLIFLLSALVASAIAQELQDSLIIGSVEVDCDQRCVSIPIYVVTFDSIRTFVANLRFDSLNSQIHFMPGVQLFPPLTEWDIFYDSINIDESFLWLIGWANVGGDPNPPLFTNGQRQHVLTFRMGIEENAQPQVACIDATLISPFDVFIPGCIYYCNPDGVSEFEEESNVNIAPFDFDCPNPASTNFSIRLNSRHENQIVISIYDILEEKL